MLCTPPVIPTAPARIYIYVLVVKFAKFTKVHDRVATCSYWVVPIVKIIVSLIKRSVPLKMPIVKECNNSIQIYWRAPNSS